MILINEALCTGCGACVRDCLNKALAVKDGKAVPLKPCFLCGHCIAVCPQNAVSMTDYDMADVMPVSEKTCTPDGQQMLDIIRCRRTIRQFLPRRVEEEKLKLVLEAGRFSPTGSNSQNVSYIVIRQNREEFTRLAMAEFRKCSVSEEAFYRVFPKPFSPDRVDFSDDNFLFKGGDTILLTVSPSDVNAAIASANMELTAEGLGLGLVYVGFFIRLVEKSEALRAWLGLSETDHVATAMSIGYPAVHYLRTVPRKPAQVKWL